MQPIEQKKPAPEQKGDGLDDLRKEGEQLTNKADGAPPGPQSQALAAAADLQAKAAARQRELEEWAGLPFVFGAIVSEAMPELKAVYTEEKCMDWAAKMMPIAERYGWTAGVAGAWCALLGVTWGMARPTYESVKKKRAENKAAAKTPEQPART